MRLTAALRSEGVDASLAVPAGSVGEDFVVDLGGPRWLRLRAHLDRMPLRRYPGRSIFAWWSNNWLPSRIVRRIKALKPDVLHLHWIGDGLLPLRAMARVTCPVVWTLHDMWAVTGGCHATGGCARYTEGCGFCPQLRSRREDDLSRRNAAAKRKSWESVCMRLVSPSRWLAGCGQQSWIHRGRRIEVIPNCVPTDRFVPRDRDDARERLGVSRDAFVIVSGNAVGVDNRLKGYAILRDALAELPRRMGGRRIVNVYFGPGDDPAAAPEGVENRGLGFIGDEEALSWIYSAADVVAVPSLEDNLPNVAVEALACGAPLVGFASGGLVEIVATKLAGRIAAEVSATALADALVDVAAADFGGREAITHRRELAVARYAPKIVARRYIELYREILASPRRRSGRPVD